MDPVQSIIDAVEATNPTEIALQSPYAEGGQSVPPAGARTGGPSNLFTGPVQDIINSAIVSSEPAEDVIEQNETFLAQTQPVEPTNVEEVTLFEEEPQTLTPEEEAFLGEEGPTPDELEAQKIQNELDQEKQTIFDELNGLLAKSDKITAEQIDAIRQNYKQLANESREISKRRQAGLSVMGFRSGRARFAPEIQSGIIATEQRALVTQLGKLAAQEAQAISEARQAQLDREFQIAAEKIAFAKDLRKEKKDALDKLQAKIEEERELQNKMLNQSKVIERVAQGNLDPISIHQELGGAVPLEEVTAITDIYKQEKMELSEAVAFAISSGGASPEEIALMEDQSLTLSERKNIAYGVVGRIAKEDRAIDRRLSEAQLANIYSQIQARKDAIKDEKEERMKETEQNLKTDSEKAIAVLTLVNDLFDSEARALGTGTSAYLSFGFGGELSDFNKTHEQLKNLLTLENLDLMSGVLSETDVQILASAATKLDLGLSEQGYEDELTKIRNVFQNNSSLKKAVEMGYVSELDYAVAMGFDEEEVAGLVELGVIPQAQTGISSLQTSESSSYYGTY